MKAARPLGGASADPSPGMMAAPVHTAHEGGTLVHRALLYRSPEQFTTVAGRFLQDGVTSGDATVAIVSPAVAEMLRERLGDGAGPVEFVDAGSWYTAPVQAMAKYYERTARDWWPQGRLRVLTEPVWDGRSELEVREWLRHEAVVSRALAATPTTMMCAYDAVRLPSGIVAAAARAHPELADADTVRPSPRHADPALFYAECNAHPLDPPPLSAARRAFAAGELPMLRTFLNAEAARLDLPEEQMLPFVLAVNEVATVIIREGGGYGAVWVWSHDGELVCDITDPGGRLPDHFLGHLPPAPHQTAEATFWAVRRLCHIVEIRSGEGPDGGVGFRGVDAGTRVRVHMLLR
ncbi:MEDS domain-containing protein [Actinomadura hibisca]|uniref:MEDS domain-containing protein n=1 Tax=Actinomadura hibisca TaxID=68565 RepID=UPI000A78FBB2|nr:MEDS domain-containing protein [Actinomadura hibisca]